MDGWGVGGDDRGVTWSFDVNVSKGGMKVKKRIEAATSKKELTVRDDMPNTSQR